MIPASSILFLCYLLAPAPAYGREDPVCINKNPSFEEFFSDNSVAFDWNFRDIQPWRIDERLSAPPIQFSEDPSEEVTRRGTGYCLMTLWEGAIFPPASVRLGQSVKLLKDYLYSIVIWVRVHHGTTIFGKEGALVSTFCEDHNGGGFIGKDSTLDAVHSTTNKTDYSRIQFDVVGNGEIWDCYIGLLGQPTSDFPARAVRMYVDDFRVWEKKQLIPPNLTDNALADGEFDDGLSEIVYINGKARFFGATPWHLDFNRYFHGSPIPVIKDGRLHLRLEANPNIGEFLGVYQQVNLTQGQKYQLSVDYSREEPASLPDNVGVSIFNYYVRMPDAGGRDQTHIRGTEGLLLGLVDVRQERGDGPSGTSSVVFVAPRTTIYEVVLKLNAYGNPGLGAYEMSYDNARLMPIDE